MAPEVVGGVGVGVGGGVDGGGKSEGVVGTSMEDLSHVSVVLSRVVSTS